MNVDALKKGKGGATVSEDSFGTPLFLSAVLQGYFGAFTCDLASEAWSCVCEWFITKRMDFFKMPELRTPHGFGNWPYGKGQLIRFVSSARERVVRGFIPQLTQLVPCYPADGWWQYVMKPEGKVYKTEWRYDWLEHERLKNWTRYMSAGLGIDVITIKGRLKHRYPPGYTGKRTISPFSSAVVRFFKP